jgi:hypothetical protein
MLKRLPIIIVFVFGLLMAIQYFVPHRTSQKFYEIVIDWTQVIGIFAMPLAIYSMVNMQIQKIKMRSAGWGYSLISIVCLFYMIIAGIPSLSLNKGYAWGFQIFRFMDLFEYVYIPISATMFSLLAFFIASAAYRAFRVRSVLASIVLISAVIVMIGRVPIGESISPLFPRLAEWIMHYPNMAAQRAISLGVGLGGTATAIKIVLGIERSYLGRD